MNRTVEKVIQEIQDRGGREFTREEKRSYLYSELSDHLFLNDFFDWVEGRLADFKQGDWYKKKKEIRDKTT